MQSKQKRITFGATGGGVVLLAVSRRGRIRGLPTSSVRGVRVLVWFEMRRGE